MRNIYLKERAINATLELFNKLDYEIDAREQVININENKPEEKDRFIYEINNISKRVIDYLKSRITIINTYITKDYANEIKETLKGHFEMTKQNIKLWEQFKITKNKNILNLPILTN